MKEYVMSKCIYIYGGINGQLMIHISKTGEYEGRELVIEGQCRDAPIDKRNVTRVWICGPK